MANPQDPKAQKSNQAPNKANQNAPTTGHAWDGIEEYNNPLPRWWVWVFLACILFAIGYVIYYPAIPGKTSLSGWSSRGQLDQAMAQAQQEKQQYETRVASMEAADIKKDPELNTYAVAAGKAIFANNCSQCHGAGGAGNKGFPNLLDDEWLHGGTLAAIVTTITHGVRSQDDPDTRQAVAMPSFGKDGTLTPEQVQDVANYLSVLGEGATPNESTQRGQQIFADNCAACHGDKGEGNRDMGAPPLNNAIWLYGPKTADHIDVITNGRAGIMPAWAKKLSPQQIKEVALYVFSLGGGEADAPAAAPAEASPTTEASPTAAVAPAPAAAPAPAPMPAPAPAPAAK